MIIQEENPGGESETSEFEGFESHMRKFYDQSNTDFAANPEKQFIRTNLTSQPKINKKFRSILTLNEFDALEESNYMFGNLKEKCRFFGRKIANFFKNIWQDAMEQINMSFVDVVVTGKIE